MDLETHRSTCIDRSLADASDVIFVFDDRNRDAFLKRFPHADAKLHMLGDMLAAGDVEISDPYGGDIERFDDTYKKIAEAIDRLK